MKEILETMPRIELALIIIGVFALMLGIIFVYAMIHEYRMYLEEHRKARITFRDFFKQEQFYIFLFLASIFIMLLNLLYFLESISAISRQILITNIKLNYEKNYQSIQ